MKGLSVKASGMVTAVGFNARASCAAIRAGINGVKVANLWDAKSGEYIAAGKVPLPQWWEGLGKLAELVAPAIQECLRTVEQIPPETIPILLGVAGPKRPSRFLELETTLLNEIEYRLQVPHHPKSKVFPQGRVSGVFGLHHAQQLIESGVVTYCIVAGVDSFLQQEVVEAYMTQRRVFTAENSNGFHPGEAGCAVLVSKARDKSQNELRIIGLGFGDETGTIESDLPSSGDGLTQALRTALAQAGIRFSDTDYWLNDQNGEHYKFKEATIAKIRLERIRDNPRERRFEVWHPIEDLGDIGAAVAPCLLGVALAAHTNDYAPGSRALLHVSADDGKRGALVLEWGLEVH